MTTGNNNHLNIATISSRYKMVPPILTKGYGYSKWKYKLEIWQVLTPWEKEKQGYPASSFFTDQVNKLKNLIENLGSENGVRFVIIELQKLYLKDESFELAKSRKSLKFSMPSDITIPVTIFEQ